MGRITPSARQLYEALVGDLRRSFQAAMIDRSHVRAFDLLLQDAWEPEQAAMANSSKIPVVIDRMNLMANVHNRKLVDTLTREVQAKEVVLRKLQAELVELKERADAMRKKEEKKGEQGREG